jgi:hypothetical protein
MDIDSIIVGTPGVPLTPGQKNYLARTKGCFYCRKTNAGHIAKFCPEKDRQQGQQPTSQRANVNVTEPTGQDFVNPRQE